MKYPQLVSNRAVNAISDWLVSRLEQLGVESPQIYTRLLLSLLQSSVQINDPIEFSNLETFFANRKGNNRRYLECDTNTLKKLNAVQCLREIVSSEQELVTLENLVDELCEKIQHIEQQSTDVNNEDTPLLATLSVANVNNVARNIDVVDNACSSAQVISNNIRENPNQQEEVAHQIHAIHQQQQQNPFQKQHFSQKHRTHSLSGTSSSVGTVEVSSSSAAAAVVKDIETDPKKRYFRAFPALSKEMEESFRIWRRNAKSLTWPVDRSNISSAVSSSSNSSQNSSSNSTISTSLNSSREVQALNTSRSVGSTVLKGDIEENFENLKAEDSCGGAAGLAGTAGVKRKSKRRRNQALSKSLRKNTAAGTALGSIGARNQRNFSPTYWDTDFEGVWEMGRDLIKEFIVKQNKGKNRNRSTSESAAYNMPRDIVVDEESFMLTEPEPEPEQQCCEAAENTSKASSPILPAVDISFCCEDETDNTLASLSELTPDCSLQSRPLYQREIYNKPQKPTVVMEQLSTCSSVEEEQLDFAQFKAKFNKSVEALWKDVEPEPQSLSTNVNDYFSLIPSSSSSTAVDYRNDLPFTAVAAPFKENLRHFWSNIFNNNQFDLSSNNKQQQLQQETQQQLLNKSNISSGGNSSKMDDCSANSLSCSGSSGCNLNSDLANTSDYYSMPSNLDDFDKSVGGVRREMGLLVGGGGDGNGDNANNNTPLGVYFQNSIWSENSNTGAGDTDESFYFKVWNSTKKLHNHLDAVQGKKIKNTKNTSLESQQQLEGSNSNAGVFNFATYNVSKWSEGINAGPNHVANMNLPQQQQQQTRRPHADNSLNIIRNYSGGHNQLGIDCTDASSSCTSGCVSSSTSCSNSSVFASTQGGGSGSNNSAYHAAGAYNWQTPNIGSMGTVVAAGREAVLQADLNSWSNCNPMSLTEMYGSVGGVVAASTAVDSAKRAIVGHHSSNRMEVAGPLVTLPNHAPASSGFVEYSRIKAVTKLLSPPQPYGNQARQLSAKNTVTAASASAALAAGEEENLLTSERTHFHPIKSYADGYTFDICSALDVIEYERSQSGHLMFDSERYMEYTRSDLFMAEEEAVLGGFGASATPLYAASNCEAALAAAKKQTKPKKEHFILKFRLRNCNMACQTEEQPPLADQISSSLLPPYNLFSRIFKTESTKEEQKRLASKEAALAAVAAVAQAAVAHNQWLPLENSNYSSIWQQECNEMEPVDSSCDEVDFVCNASDPNQQWSMREIDKLCWQNGHIKCPESNAGESNWNLWSLCAACNNEGISLPANRRLRDELQHEADEIMGDLQDLYIGGANIISSEDDLSNDSEWEEEVSRIQPEHQQQQHKTPISMLPQQSPADVLQSVNQLIADLLQQDVTDAAPQQNICSFWYGDDNERSIWQPQDKQQHEGSIKPLQLMAKFGCLEEAADAIIDEGNEMHNYEQQLNWQHEKLAAIWQRQVTAEQLKQQQHEEQQQQQTNSNAAEYKKVVYQEPTSKFCFADSSSNTAPKINSKSAATAAYKRIQQFLASSGSCNAASKLKMAANRKRRHSASQNYYNNLLQSSHNNNNANIADLNQYNEKLNSSNTEACLFAADIDVQSFIKSALFQKHQQQQQPIANKTSKTTQAENHPLDADKQTIITCKYWTTLSPMPDDVLLDPASTFSCLIDKNTSILKHVAMVTRPLTR